MDRMKRSKSRAPLARVRKTEDVARATPLALAQLSGKRRTFAREYVVDHNGAQAATRAGYSAKTAREQATRLLSNVHVAAAVRWLEDQAAARMEISLDEVLGELKILLASDVRHFAVSDQGKLELADGAPDTAWRAVSSVKQRTTTYGTGDREHTVHEV